MRRIAINWQERDEASRSGGWLAEGHNLDLVYLATAPNFDTRTNGATHMGNDDANVFSQLAHLKDRGSGLPEPAPRFHEVGHGRG